MNSGMLSLYRRHVKGCAVRDRTILNKCACPLWRDGMNEGRRMRASLDTRNLQIAWKRLTKFEEELDDGRARKLVTEATAAWLNSKTRKDPGTITKAAALVERLEALAKAHGVRYLDGITLEHLDRYEEQRRAVLNELSWAKELERLRGFFKYCVDRQWCPGNPALLLETPIGVKADRVPLTEEEFGRILAAADEFGRHPYERLRARAFLLVLWDSGLRISDAVMLRRSELSGDRLHLIARKNKKKPAIALLPAVREALEQVPTPKDAPTDSHYFFWNGRGKVETATRTMRRALKKIFARAGVERAVPHLFRHTLATDIVGTGGSIPETSRVLGDTTAITDRFYIKGSAEQDERAIAAKQRARTHVPGTILARENFVPGSGVESTVGMVTRAGLEPTTL